MNEITNKLKSLTGKISAKWIVIIGIVGIVLIYLSSLTPKSTPKAEQSQVYKTMTTEDFCKDMEKKATDIVVSITGDQTPTVVITLDSSAQYIYAGDEKQKNASEKQETEKEYITVKDSNGEEKAVIVTEYMPQIRGVAVVCIHGSNVRIREEITNAVSAALGVNSNKIYVTGTD